MWSYGAFGLRFWRGVYMFFQQILSQRTALFFNCHIDQIILCCFYGVAKICQLNLTFKEIIHNYRKQPHCKPQVFRAVFVDDRSSSRRNGKPGQDHVDIIMFYNQVFIPAVKPLLVELAPIGVAKTTPTKISEANNNDEGLMSGYENVVTGKLKLKVVRELHLFCVSDCVSKLFLHSSRRTRGQQQQHQHLDEPSIVLCPSWLIRDIRPNMHHHNKSLVIFVLYYRTPQNFRNQHLNLLNIGSDMGTMAEEETNDGEKSKGASYLESMTPAERRYMEQRQKIDMQKMAKTSNKSHRDRLSEFNQYLANMSEHYDIPKVGPG
ncbi:retinoblastoma-related protein [Artemisia annua]|uniref:Retinoblastoma-related protein n=1 Tax=Artemisia annua TaxID=35608 RepID=A0A2U1P383_ARTAN|nr:retinoblastoma-related protein [Artemisia annua]